RHRQGAGRKRTSPEEKRSQPTRCLTTLVGVRHQRRGVGELGRPRRAHNPEIVGSNPTTATKAVRSRTWRDPRALLFRQFTDHRAAITRSCRAVGVLATLSRWRSRVQVPSGPRSRRIARTADPSERLLHLAEVAQLVGSLTSNQAVAGSNPVSDSLQLNSNGRVSEWPMEVGCKPIAHASQVRILLLPLRR